MQVEAGEEASWLAQRLKACRQDTLANDVYSKPVCVHLCDERAGRVQEELWCSLLTVLPFTEKPSWIPTGREGGIAEKRVAQ